MLNCVSFRDFYWVCTVWNRERGREGKAGEAQDGEILGLRRSTLCWPNIKAYKGNQSTWMTHLRSDTLPHCLTNTHQTMTTALFFLPGYLGRICLFFSSLLLATCLFLIRPSWRCRRHLARVSRGVPMHADDECAIGRGCCSRNICSLGQCLKSLLFLASGPVFLSFFSGLCLVAEPTLHAWGICHSCCLNIWIMFIYSLVVWTRALLLCGGCPGEGTCCNRVTSRSEYQSRIWK